MERRRGDEGGELEEWGWGGRGVWQEGGIYAGSRRTQGASRADGLTNIKSSRLVTFRLVLFL